MTQPPYIVQRRALSAAQCDALTSKRAKWKSDLDYDTLDKGDVVGKQALLERKDWPSVFDAIFKVKEIANRVYGFALEDQFKDRRFYQPVRIRKYNAGETIPWHQDYGMGDDYDDPSKLTIAFLLNKPSEFGGGELEFMPYGTPKLNKGDAIAFPSFLTHRVGVVSQGTRYSLTAWFSGPSFV